MIDEEEIRLAELSHFYAIMRTFYEVLEMRVRQDRSRRNMLKLVSPLARMRIINRWRMEGTAKKPLPSGDWRVKKKGIDRIIQCDARSVK